MFIVHCSHGATLIFDDLFSISYRSREETFGLTPDIEKFPSSTLRPAGRKDNNVEHPRFRCIYAFLCICSCHWLLNKIKLS